MTKEFAEKIRNKYLLFDTGVIIRAFEHFEIFEGLFSFLKQNNCAPVFFSLIEFEFIRGANTQSNKKKRDEFLEFIAMEQMSFKVDNTKDDIIAIANAYSARKHFSASVVDCCIASFLKKYSKNLFLVTLNHKDFPTFLFDRIFIYPVDTDKEVFPIGFYQFNEEKAKKIKIM